MFRDKSGHSASKAEKDEGSGLRSIFRKHRDDTGEKSRESQNTSGHDITTGKVGKGLATPIVEDAKSQNKDTLPDPVSEREPQSRMKQMAAGNLNAASMKLDRLMPRDATERRIPGGIESPSFDVDFTNIDSMAHGIGTAIENYMDQRSELKASRGQVKVFVEKWFNASYPVIKKGLDVAAVCLLELLANQSSASRSSPVWTSGYRDGVSRKGNSGL